MKNNPKEQKRDKKIVAVSIISIAANVVLASFKATAGIVSGSISIILDAVNNLSDALSSIITIIGTKLSLKPCPALCDPMGCRFPGSSVHGILQEKY